MDNKLLSNLKVLDFTTLLPGPYATLMLADMGAEVLKVSAPGRPDLVLESEPKLEEENLSANLLWINRNKKTITLNLKKEEGINIVKKLVKEYDIIIEQFRPGVMKSLGLSYEDLREINEKIIYCSITGYGQTGPLRDRAGHDINCLARSGLMSHSGRKNDGPSLMGTQIADICSASMNAVAGILAAVNFRHETGKGQYIDISMLDGLIPFNSFGGTEFLFDNKSIEREETLLNGGCIYDFYETKDKRYISVGSLEPKFWEEFCEKIEMPELIEKTVWPQNLEEEKNKVKEKILSKTLEEWIDIFKDADCCVEPVLSLEEAFNEDAHIRERELIVEVDYKGRNIRQYGMPIKFSEYKPNYESLGKKLGSDNEEILKSLKYTEDEIKNLIEGKVI